MPSILETFEAKHPTSKRLSARAEQVFPSGVTHDQRLFEPFRVYIERGQGPRKWDVDGNEYVDYVGGHGALLLGHNREPVMEAIREALEQSTHFGASHEREIEWGEQVIKMVPCAERVRFTSSGTEATMMALRLARAYTDRNRIVKVQEHFHGWHDLVAARQGPDDPTPYSPGVAPGFYDDLIIVPPNDPQRLEEALAGRDVAALILEPTGAHWGTEPLYPDYLQEARRLTEESGTVFVMDEVITGFRMAPGGAQERYGVTPDLSSFAKIVAGGLPGGCVAGRADIVTMIEARPDDEQWNAKRRIAHPGTYNANPVTAAAGTAALRIIEDGEPCRRADAATAELVTRLNELLRQEGVPGSTWCASSMWHTNLGWDAPTPEGHEWQPQYGEPRGILPQLRRPFRQALFNHGVDLMVDGGMVSDTHGERELHDTVEGFRRAIADLRTEGLLE